MEGRLKDGEPANFYIVCLFILELIKISLFGIGFGIRIFVVFCLLNGALRKTS